MKTRSLLLASLLLGIAALPSPSAFAADASASPSPAAKVTKFPFHGKVQAVDTTAMTFTLASKTPRVFAVTETTKIRKNGQTATLKDAVVGDDTGGYAEKSADGKLTALSVRFGPRTAAKTVATTTTGAAAASSPSASPTPKSKHKLLKSKASPSPSPTAA